MLFFGRLSETHLRNLQSAPFIYFEGVKEVNLSYDLDSKSTSWFVRYEFNTDVEQDHLKERSEYLEKAIRLLFWKEVSLQLQINGKEVYKSE
jgi:hypothetical protein